MEEERWNICKRCPLYTIRYGGQCNNKLWLDVDTNDVSTSAKPGYIRGCGCLLENKIKNPASVCPCGKW